MSRRLLWLPILTVAGRERPGGLLRSTIEGPRDVGWALAHYTIRVFLTARDESLPALTSDGIPGRGTYLPEFTSVYIAGLSLPSIW